MATSDAVLESALLKATTEEPHFSAWIERSAPTLPALYRKVEGRDGLLLVYYKHLDQN